MLNNSRSTGPRTPEGKARSAMNRLKHGLTGKFVVLFHESQEAFDAAHQDLIDEHCPASPVEFELVRRMAESAWLSRRAQWMLDDAFINNENDRIALCLRYQAALDRTFYKALHELERYKREHEPMDQFVSQNEPSEADGPEFESQKSPSGPPSDPLPEPETPLPGDENLAPGSKHPDRR